MDLLADPLLLVGGCAAYGSTLLLCSSHPLGAQPPRQATVAEVLRAVSSVLQGSIDKSAHVRFQHGRPSSGPPRRQVAAARRPPLRPRVLSARRCQAAAAYRRARPPHRNGHI